MRKRLVSSIPATTYEVSLHVVLYLPAQVALGTGIDHKLPGVGLI